MTERYLTGLYRLAQRLIGNHDPDTLLSCALACLIDDVAMAQAGAIWLKSSQPGELVLRSAHGCDAEALAHWRPPKNATEWEGTPAVGVWSTVCDAPAPGASLETTVVSLPERGAGGGLLVLFGTHASWTDHPQGVKALEMMAELIAGAVDAAHHLANRQTEHAVAEANRLKAELISTLAHEMRTPLTSIKGYSTALLMEEAHFDDATQREFLQFIDEECDILQNLIRDLLEASIIDAGLLRLEKQPVLLPRLAQSVVNDIARRNPSHRLVVDFPARFPIVDADPDRIAQVLRNLLDNAVKYSPEGSLVVVRGAVQGEEVIVSVADQGVGIAPEHLNRLFEKFFRVEVGLGRHVVGSGLGLPIARTVVESHGGRIWAESRVGHGSTLYFTLPLTNADKEGNATEEMEG